jgi:hypothetical protein
MKALKIRYITALITSIVLISIGAFKFTKEEQSSAQTFFTWGLIALVYSVSSYIFYRKRQSKF